MELGTIRKFIIFNKFLFLLMNLMKNVWLQNIRNKSNGYHHINGILIIKIFGKYRKIRNN